MGESISINLNVEQINIKQVDRNDNMKNVSFEETTEKLIESFSAHMLTEKKIKFSGMNQLINS